MRRHLRRHIVTMTAALALGVIGALAPGGLSAVAQDYPTHVVRIVVPYPAGGTADVMPRILAEWLSRKWGQSVIIDNRTGAGGNIGAEVAAKADPDGYTLLASPPGPLVINQNLYPHLDFDPLQFVPITVMGHVPNALVVNPDKIKADTVKDFIAYAQANPGKITDATQGNGTTSHLTSELFQLMAHVKLQNVPYRGSAPALNDLVAGNVDCMFDNLGVSMQFVKAGKLKLIAVASPERVQSLPNVPTIAETLPGLRGGDLVRAGRAAKDARRHRRQDQRRRERGVARSDCAGPLCQLVCHTRWRHATGDRGLLSRRGRTLEESDRLGARDVGLTVSCPRAGRLSRSLHLLGPCGSPPLSSSVPSPRARRQSRIRLTRSGW